jgi:hypothetical protein
LSDSFYLKLELSLLEGIGSIRLLNIQIQVILMPDILRNYNLKQRTICLFLSTFHQAFLLICIAIDCGRLPEPQHGEKIEETTTTYGGKVVFRCKKEGYELKGSAQRICQENGKWDGTMTTCERKYTVNTSSMVFK